MTVRSRLIGFDRTLEEAAQDLGANGLQTFSVTLPLIAPGVLAAALLAFALSIDDFVITNFNAGSTVTFPLFVWGARASQFRPDQHHRDDDLRRHRDPDGLHRLAAAARRANVGPRPRGPRRLGGMSARERIGGGVVGAVAALPRRVQRALAGRPTVIDGHRLDPEVQSCSCGCSDERRARTPRRRPRPAGRGHSTRTSSGARPSPWGTSPSTRSLALRARSGRASTPRRGRPPRRRCSSTCTEAAGSCATSTRTTTCAGSSHARRARSCSRSTTGWRRTRFPAAVDDALAAFRYGVEAAGELGRTRGRSRSAATAPGRTSPPSSRIRWSPRAAPCPLSP